MLQIDETHDPAAGSWVPSATGHGEFPIQNLPLGRILGDGVEHVVTAIGDSVLDLTALAVAPEAPPDLVRVLQPLAGGSLLPLIAAGPVASRALRHTLFGLLRDDASEQRRALVAPHLMLRAGLTMLLPCQPPTFADFYSSIHHARRIGALVRPDAQLMPNYTYMPVGYHGKSTTVFASGHAFPRPFGQLVDGPDKRIVYAPSRRLDYEAELGFLVGAPSQFGEPVPLERARDHLFGVAMLNDWSARDIQFWEYAPLGPFLGKSFASTLGGWVVTRDALEPYWVAPPWDESRSLLPHLDAPSERERGGLAVAVEVTISSQKMRDMRLPAHRISLSNSADSFWTMGQMLTHCTSNGANLSAGDLIGSGTLSGPTDESRACLMELTEGGKTAFQLPSGEERTFVQDGDEISVAGWCEAPGRARIALGAATARVTPAVGTR